jgi:hypothetical protein
MKRSLIARGSFFRIVAETTIPVIAAMQTQKISTNRSRRRTNRRIRNAAIGTAVGAAGGALIGRGARLLQPSAAGPEPNDKAMGCV